MINEIYTPYLAGVGAPQHTTIIRFIYVYMTYNIKACSWIKPKRWVLCLASIVYVQHFIFHTTHHPKILQTGVHIKHLPK